MDTENKGHGLILSEIAEDNYILGDGCLATDVVFPAGHGWGQYLPIAEIQRKNGLETQNCTGYGTLNAIETLGKKKFGAQFQTDLSERFEGILAGTTQSGNNPHIACESVRIYGVIPEVFLPFDVTITTWDKYYSPKPMDLKWLTVGQNWKKKYIYGHDWVFINATPIAQKQLLIKEALKYSPLSVSVQAWPQPDRNGVYHKLGGDNHWVELYDYVDGQYYLIYDSYDQGIKMLAWDYDFAQAKRHSLRLNLSGETDAPEKKPLWFMIWEAFEHIFSNKYAPE